MRTLSLPGRLVVIVSAAILPLAMVCAFALQALSQGQRDQTQASTLGVARALATAVDGELRLTISALQALALAPSFGQPGADSLAAARELATAVRASHGEWRSVILASPAGEVLFSTDVPPAGGALRTAVDPSSLTLVLRERQPVVGPMAKGPGGNLAVPVRVPVMRDGEVRQVLTAVLRPESIAEVLQRQQVPAGWTVSVFDANSRRVARTVDDQRLRGTPPSPSMQALLATLGERRVAVGRGTTIDGVRVQTAVARLDAADWTLALGAPVSTIEGAWHGTLLAYGGGLLVSLALGGLAAWWLSGVITGPMARLRRNADALGRGEALVAQQPSGILEIDHVADALAAAEVQTRLGQTEREALLQAERHARTQAEAAERRLARLVDASAVLSRSLEEATTLSAIAAVIVPEVADLCRIDLLDEDGRLQRKLTHHLDPRRTDEIASMVNALAGSSEVPGSFPWAIATGKTFLHNIDDPDLPEIGDPQMRRFIQTLGIRAGCVVPLVARGRTIGAMAVLQAESNRRFTPDDGALIGELAQRAALALDNVRLFARARTAQAQAEAANQAKDEFLAMLGHELRNPLAPISLALQLMARRDAQAFPRERQIIERQVRHLSRMVDDLLDVSRIVSGKIALRPEAVDLRDVVARAMELTLPALQQRAAMPALQLPEAPVPVRGDPVRLAQIVCNLLNNAAKFTPPERGIALALRVDATRQCAELSVSDEGIGIAPALLPRVFERFVQGDQPLQRASGGLGLGLAIAQSLAQLHGGRVEAHSAGEGQGSRFTVQLPLDAQAAPLAAPAAPDAASRPALRILVVDDNRDAAEALGDWFEMEGHAARTAGSAEEALHLLEREPHDAAVLDIGLPGMDGYELAQRLRANPRTRMLALVALTGYGREADRERALQAGFDDHFAKPAQVELLLARLHALLADLDGGATAAQGMPA